MESTKLCEKHPSIGICLYLVIMTIVTLSPSVRSLNNITCSDPAPPGGRIPLHIRSIMTFESEPESGEFAAFLEAAAEHVNGMDEILQDYYICFRWDHATVSTSGNNVLK